MATVYAQHATVGKYHLETTFVDGQWEWGAVPIRHTAGQRLPEFAGVAKTLEDAKKSAAASIGLSRAQWLSIGPVIEVPG